MAVPSANKISLLQVVFGFIRISAGSPLILYHAMGMSYYLNLHARNRKYIEYHPNGDSVVRCNAKTKKIR